MFDLRSLLLETPDIIICDEGHVLKNSNTDWNQMVSKITTKRRVILSGTPIQNNLVECKFLNEAIKLIFD